MAYFELVDDHSPGSLTNKIQLSDARYHVIRSPTIAIEPPTRGPLELPCCVHCYRLAGQLVPVSSSEAHYHMKKYGHSPSLPCIRPFHF